MQVLSFEQTDQMRALTQLAHLPLERLVIRSRPQSGAPEGLAPSGDCLSAGAMFRPVYASGYRRLTEEEILGRLPMHMRVAAAKGSVSRAADGPLGFASLTPPMR